MADAATPKIDRRGLLLVLSSPSGAGKTTLARRLVEADREHRHVGLGDHARAAARRDRRPRLSFHRRKPTSSACARAASCSNGRACSATSTARRARPSRAASRSGRDILFDIDWQGAQQLVREDEARRRPRVHPAAVGRGARASACSARAQDTPRSCAAAWRRLGRDQPLARIRLRHRQRRLDGRSRASRRS